MRRLLANLLVALASALATLLVFEGALRLALGSRRSVSEAETRLQWIEHDPLLGWRKRAGSRATYRRPEYTVEVTTNSHGLRDRERSYEAPPGTFRVLALGDSFVEAYGVPLESTFTSILETRLTRPACPVEVLNGGTQGYSTDQEYLFYLSEGVRYSPQVVVLFFYYNDVLYNGRSIFFGSPKPRFEVREGRLVPPSGPVRRPALDRPSEPEGPERGTGGEEASRPLLERSALLAFVGDRLMRGAPGAYDSLAALGLWEPIPLAAPFIELKVYRRQKLIPEIEEAWATTVRLLEAMARDVESHGSRFLVAYVPARMEVREADWQLTRLRFGLDDERWDRRRVLGRLEEIGRSAGIPVLDLTPALRKADRGILGGPYYGHDLHWNAAGHRVAAAEVEAFLRREGWLPPCALGEGLQ